MSTNPSAPIALADCQASGWQDYLDPCPEHGRACGPFCVEVWGRPTERMVRRAVGMPTARLLAAVKEVGRDD